MATLKYTQKKSTEKRIDIVQKVTQNEETREERRAFGRALPEVDPARVGPGGRGHTTCTHGHGGTRAGLTPSSRPHWGPPPHKERGLLPEAVARYDAPVPFSLDQFGPLGVVAHMW